MGRMITGDINGKCWFALQSSDFADRFGVTGHQPEILQYYFDESNLSEIESELELIEEKWGSDLENLKKYFEEYNGYNDDGLMEYLEIKSKDKFRHLLSDYADYIYGVQIRDCINENGWCEFEVEL